MLRPDRKEEVQALTTPPVGCSGEGRPGRRKMAGAVVLLIQLVVSCAPLVQAAEETYAKAARDILEATGVRGGLVVHLECTDGKLTAALHASDAYLVHGLDADPKNVASARGYIRSLGLYGEVSADLLPEGRLPYTDNLVNLVVSEGPLPVSMEEVMRVLCPLGVAFVKEEGSWNRTVKPRPDDIDEWTHYLHGADKNAVANDTRVQPPRHLQWKSGPVWCRSHDGVPDSIAALVSSNGRIFCIQDEGVTGQPKLPQQWRLVARDAFNGTLLWKRPVSSRSPWCIVADGDRVYVTLKNRGPLSILDAATGETLKTCKGTGGTSDVICSEGVVVVYARNQKQARRSKNDSGERIIAVDGKTGRTIWNATPKRIHGNSLTAKDSRVCYHNGGEVVCLNLDNGEELWRTSCRKGKPMLIYKGAVVISAGGLRAFSLSNGKLLWNRRGGGGFLFGANGLVWPNVREVGPGSSFHWGPKTAEVAGYDIMTGEVKKKISVEGLVTPGHHFRCYRPKATERYLLMTKRGVEFLDMRGENHMRHNWLRAPCRHGFVPCNGLLYMPPHPCFCYPGVRLDGFNAFSGEARNPTDESAQSGERLVRGPAWGTAAGEARAADGKDWPVYRHDARRSGSTKARVPAELSTKWVSEPIGAISQPVVVDGKLYVAEIDAHSVRCFDADTGEKLWVYTAGGRIDSAPTFYRGLLLFGSADGWVYCLRASDGDLVWRFRAAPAERLITSSGRLESAWPVHGSLVVQHGLVYFTAGRSSYLDGGIYAYAVRPETGKIVHQTRLWSGRPDISKDPGRPFDMEGTRTDILVSDGEDLYMFQTRLNPDLTRQETPRLTKLGDREVSPHLMSNSGLLDTEWFDRSYWIYGRRWPGYYFGYDAPNAGNILVFDEETTYGLHVFTHRRGHSPVFKPGGEGYELFADSNDNMPVLRPTEIGREKGTSYTRALLPRWSQNIPVRVRAMVLAGEHLFIAGPPDEVPADEPLAAFEGRMGARLRVVSAADGRMLTEYKLDRLPVFDGMIAADGCLYIAAKDGRILCMSAK